MWFQYLLKQVSERSEQMHYCNLNVVNTCHMVNLVVSLIYCRTMLDCDLNNTF